MKSRGWTRVLSTLLTIAMIATLLVVPAGAAVGDVHTIEAKATPTVDSFFTFDTTKASQFGALADSNSVTEWADKYPGTTSASNRIYYIKFGGTTKYGSDGSPMTASSNAGRYVGFTTTGPVSVKIWVKNGQSTAELKKGAATEMKTATKIQPTSTAGNIYQWDLTEAGTYGLTAGGTLQFAKLTVTEVDPNAVTVKLDKEKASTTVGGTVELTPTITNGDGASVAWSSSKENVATVTGDATKGTVTPVGSGTTTITLKVTKDGTDYTASCEVSVIPEQDAVLHIFDDSTTLPTVPQDSGLKVAVGKGTSATVDEDGYFLDATSAGIASETTTTKYKANKAFTKLAKYTSGGREFKFVAPGAGTMTVYFAAVSGKSGNVTWSEDGGDASSATNIGEGGTLAITTKAGSEYTVARASSSGGNTYPAYMIWTASDWSTKHTHDYTVEATEDGKVYKYCSNPACLEKTEGEAVVPVESVEFQHTVHTVYIGGDESGWSGDPVAGGSATKYPGKWKLAPTVTPSNANGYTLQFLIPDDQAKDIFSVDQATGVVSPLKVGNANVTVVAINKDNSQVTAKTQCQIRVRPYVKSVSVSGDTSVKMGETLDLTATVTTASGAADDQDLVWAVTSGDAATVAAKQGATHATAATVTPVKVGSVTITATRKADSNEHIAPLENDVVSDPVTITVNKGEIAEWSISAKHEAHGSAASTAVVTATGIPEGELRNITVKAQTGSEAEIEGIYSAENKNWTLALPENTDNTQKTYNITATFNNTTSTNWTVATATATDTVTKQAAGAKAIQVTVTGNPALTGNAVSVTEGATLTLTATVKTANDQADVSDKVDYQWYKDNAAMDGKTQAALTVDTATVGKAVYYCEATPKSDATDLTGATATNSADVTVTVTKAPITKVDATLNTVSDKVTYNADTKALTVKGGTPVTFTITTTPAGRTSELSVINARTTYVDVKLEGDKLTITPKRALKVTSEENPWDVGVSASESTEWRAKLTVNLDDAPDPLTADQVEAVAPTTPEGKGTIKIKNPVQGTTYCYREGTEAEWTDIADPAAGVQVDAGATHDYYVRVRVDANLVNVPTGLLVRVPAYTAPKHTLTLTLTKATAKVNGTDYTAPVQFSEDEEVVVTVIPEANCTLPNNITIPGVNAANYNWDTSDEGGTLTIDANAMTADTTITIRALAEGETATNPKVHTFGEVTGLADIIGTAADYTTGQNGTGFIKITNSKMVGTEKTDADGNSVAGYYFKGVRSLTASKPTAADRTMTMTAPEAGGKFTLYVNNNAQGKNAKAGGVKVVKGSETVDTIDIPVGVGVYTVDAATAGDYDLTGTLVTEAYPFIYAVVWTPAGYADHTGHTASDKWTEMTDLATTATCQKKATKSYYCNADPVCFVTRTEEVGELADHHYVDGVCEWCGTAQTGGGALTDITVSTEAVTLEANKTVTVTVKKDPLAADDTLKIKTAPAAATATATLENGVLTIKGVAVGETSVVLSGTTAESVTKTITIKVTPQTSYTFDGEVDLKDEAAGADLAGKKYADDMIEGVGAGKITAQGTYAKLAKKKAGYFKVTIPEGKTATITIVASTNSSGADKKLDLGLYTSSWTAVPEKNGVTQLTGGTGVKTTLVYENVAAGTYNIGAVTSGDTDGRVYSVDIKLDGGEEPGPEPTTKYAVTVTGGKTNKATAAEGEEVTVSATRPAGKAFDKWTSDDLTLSEADAAKNPLTFKMPAKAVTITATFKDLVLEEGEYAISVDTEIVNGSVNVDKPKAKEGDTVTVIATPATGYELEAITVNGKAIDGTTFTMPGEAVTVSASFKKTAGGGEDPNPPTPGEDTYTITCDTAVGGSVSADKAKAKKGETVTLTVKAAEGYELDTLTVNGKAITGTTFTMPGENVTVKATFKKTGGEDPNPPTPTEVDKTKLEAALAAAKAIDPASVETSADGKDVPTTKTWVTQAVKDALAKAIADAEALAADADQAAVDAAAKALEDAVAAWAPKAGTKRTFSGGGGSSSSSSSSTGKVVATVTNPAGGKTTVKKDHEGNVTITATDDKGEVLAEVKIPATAPSVGYKFVDVPENHWAEKAINDMAGLELVKGVNEADHLFDMVSPITRGSVATILSRLANGKADVTDVFSDVAEGQWFADGVAWAAKAGVVTGFENGTFQPDGSITREQLAVMLARYAKLLGLDTDAAIGELAVFNDAESIQSWAREGMAWCVKVGIIQGRGDNSVDPGANATRAEAAVMLARLVDLLK